MKKIWLFMLLVCGFYGVVKAGDNTNPEAVLWTKKIARPTSDQLAVMYYSCKQEEQVWSAQNMGVNFQDPDNENDQVADGSQSDGTPPDGRNPVTDGNIIQIDTQCRLFTNSLEANNSANLTAILLVSVNP